MIGTKPLAEWTIAELQAEVHRLTGELSRRVLGDPRITVSSGRLVNDVPPAPNNKGGL